MNIAIIGAGNVGEALGGGWARAGHEVIYGVRHPAAPNQTTVAEAIDAAEVVALAVPWNAVRDLLSVNPCAGKVVLDCTNPILPNLAGLEHGTKTSGAEMIASLAPHAKVVKIFNTTGFANMINPAYPEGAATMFYCGDDAGAKQIARQLAADLGFDPADAGPLSQARYLEPLAMLWITMAMKYGHGRDIAFRLMRR